MATMKQIVLKEDGTSVMQTISETPVSITREAMSRHFQDMPLVLKSVFGTRRGVYSVMGLGTETWYFQKLTEIRIKTDWLLRPDGLLVPHFQDQDGTTPLDLTWSTDGTGATWYYAYGGEISKIYMFCVPNGTKQVKRPPLPNLYPDLRICTGRVSVTRDRFADEMSFLEYLFDAIESNEWNTDLMHGDIRERAQEMIQFKPTGERVFNPACIKRVWDAMPEIGLTQISKFVEVTHAAS